MFPGMDKGFFSPKMQEGLAAMLGGQAPQAPADDGPPITASGNVHKGVFGLKGTGRDILGILGDAFLAQAGRDTVYQPQRRAEKYSDAMLDFGSDPAGALARARKIDPKQASIDEMEYNDGQADKATLAQTAEKDARADFYKRKEFEDGVVERASRLFATATNDNWEGPTKLYKEILAKNNITDPFNVPDQYDEAAVARIRASNLSEKDRASLEGQEAYRDAQIGLGQQRIGVQREGVELRRQGLNLKREDTAADNARFDKNVASQIKTRENPPAKKGGTRGTPAIPGKPPLDASKYPGKKLTGSDGSKWRSTGKTWVRQ